MRPSGGPIIRGVFAGGLLFVGGMTVVAVLAIISGLVPSIDTGANADVGLRQWILIELGLGLPLAAVSGSVARSVGRSIRAPGILAAAILLIGSLEALTLLSSGFIPPGSMTGIPVLVAPLLASAAVMAGGRVPRFLATDVLRRWTLPAIVILTGAMAGLYGIPLVEEFGRQRIVAYALVLDLVFITPLIVYGLFIRTGRLPLISVVPVAVLGYGIAALSTPEDHEVVVGAVRWAVVPAELLLLSVVAVRARRMFRNAPHGGGDIQRLRETARRVMGSRIAADILTTEIAVLYYALRLRSTGTSRVRLAPQHSFTVHRSVGYAAVLAGLGLALVVETFAVHILVRQASTIAAWILTGLSCYAMLWLIGDFRALRSRLTSVVSGHLSFRMGLRWEVDIPLSCINSASRMSAAATSDDPDAFSGVLLGSPNTRIKLHRPVLITGMYGLRKRASVLHVRMDNPDGFLSAIGAESGSE